MNNKTVETDMMKMTFKTFFLGTPKKEKALLAIIPNSSIRGCHLKIVEIIVFFKHISMKDLC